MPTSLARGFRTNSRTVYGEQSALRVVAKLVSLSTWFELEPLPDDAFQVTVKSEELSLLSGLISRTDQ